MTERGRFEVFHPSGKNKDACPEGAQVGCPARGFLRPSGAGISLWTHFQGFPFDFAQGPPWAILVRSLRERVRWRRKRFSSQVPKPKGSSWGLCGPTEVVPLLQSFDRYTATLVLLFTEELIERLTPV